MTLSIPSDSIWAKLVDDPIDSEPISSQVLAVGHADAGVPVGFALAGESNGVASRRGEISPKHH